MRFNVVVVRGSDGVWLARIPSVRGCHTYGRALGQTRERIREALTLWVNDPDSAELTFDERLPAKIRTELERAHTARQRSVVAAREAQETLRAAAATLTSSLALSRRDAAELLGLSHQRVQQLLKG